LVEYGFRLPAAMDNRPLKFEEFEGFEKQTIYLSATPADYEYTKTEGVVVEQIIRPTGLIDPPIDVRPSLNQIDDLIAEINSRAKKNERVLVTTLTKRMAEELAEYFEKIRIRSRYIHSDVDTVERVQIMEDQRKGLFDVLIGVNLLREGLDLPEVSLVAILDADKEGFLRSVVSLVQTIGRAARNVNGMAILYGDKVTKSMRQAIDETERRREKQNIFNIKKGIEPKTVYKSVTDIMELEIPGSGLSLGNVKTKVAESVAEYKVLTPKQAAKKLKQLEDKMYKHAKDLEFEAAAAVRDEIKVLQAEMMV